MSLNLNRILFLGLGQFGADVLFQVKRNLTNIRTPNGRPLLYKGCDQIDNNPFQFLIIGENQDNSPQNLFRRFSFTGSDYDLICPEEEISSLNDSEKQISDYFKNSISRLSNFNFDLFLESSGIAISTYRPAIILVIEESVLNQTSDQYLSQWETVQDLVTDPEDIVLKNKFHSHALCYIHRVQENANMVKSLASFHNIFLFNEESELILSDPDDKIDIASSFLSVMAQMKDMIFMDYFSQEKTGRFFTFGAASLFYPRIDLLSDMIVKILGHPDYGYAGSIGDRFKKIYIGEFEDVNPGEDADPFSLGSYEPESDKQNAPQTEEIRPFIRPGIKNRAHRLSDDAYQWLSSHINRLKEKLSKDALKKRIDEMTSVSTFREMYLDSWIENIDALDFLLKYDVLERAKANAKIAKDEFTNRWKDKIEEVFENIRSLINDQGTFTNEHNGELAWCFAKDTVAHIREALLPQQDKTYRETQYQQQSSTNREEVINAIQKTPRKNSLFLRYLIIATALFFFWDSVHNLVFQIIDLNPVIVPSWITGSVFMFLFCFALYWYGYRKKILILLDILRRYLNDKLEAHHNEINEIEQKLMREFLIDAAIYLREHFSTRTGFFYHIVKQNSFDFNALKMEGFSQFEGKPNRVETFYINRCYLYNQLQTELDKYKVKYAESAIPVQLPIVSSEPYNAIVEKLATQFTFYNRIFKSEGYKEAMDNLLLWTELLNTSGDNETDIKNMIESIISNYGAILETELDKDPEYRDLEHFRRSISYRMNNSEFSELVNRSRPTFKIQMDKNNFVGIFSAFKEYLSPEQKQKFIEILDRNQIFFLCIDGPFEFEKIEWGAAK